MRQSTFVLASALALCAFAATPSVRAGDGAKPAAEAAAIKWIDGWETGRAAAKAAGKLMLVYVHRNVPT